MELGGKGLRSEINVTPLVDVMLVLLIIFMVVTPFLEQGQSVDLPEVPKPERQPESGKDLIVSVVFKNKVQELKDGKTIEIDNYDLYLGSNPEDFDSLKTRLVDELRKASGDAPKELYLKADKRLFYETVRRVMEVCHEAGFGQVKLATEELEQKKG